MRHLAWIALIGCTAAKAPATAPPPRAAHVDSTSEAGATLAAVPIRDGKLVVPNDWHPNFSGIFPELADKMVEEWQFHESWRCIHARYHRDLTTLSASHAKWTALVAALEGPEDGWRTARLREGDHTLSLRRIASKCADCGSPPIEIEGGPRTHTRVEAS